MGFITDLETFPLLSTPLRNLTEAQDSDPYVPYEPDEELRAVKREMEIQRTLVRTSETLRGVA